MKNITFAERLKEARKAAKLSQEALANKIGRTKSTISRWESGERNPKMFEMVELEKILGVSAETLMYGTKKTSPISPIIEETVETMKKLDEPRQQVVLETANIQLKEQKAIKREKQILPFKKAQLDKINNLVPYDHEQEGFAPIIGEIAAGTPIFSEQNFEGMRPVYGKYAGRDDVFWLHVKGDSMESEIHDGSFALILLSPDIDDGAIGAVRFTDDNSATLKCVHYEYDDAGYVKRIRLEPLNPKYPIQYADESNPAEIAGRLVKVEQDY
ncbi:helix-turn-helix domain-containing protein [Lactococcus garvieae]|uniref:helix-turn-helix domain-containing protein n=1 Tax=Lactococcus garvieae TaxID=1363 RepID=UPI002549C4B4|nr:S24 family peptidase [Lactococcus garvieae]